MKPGNAARKHETATPQLDTVLAAFLKHLREQHNLSDEQINTLFEQKTSIPVSAFSSLLSTLETVVKYLKENKRLRNGEIATLLNRDPRTIWSTYHNALKKFPSSLIIAQTPYHLPADVFQDRRKSALEAVIMHLKEHYNLSLHEIAVLLKRDDSTIWITAHRKK